MKVLPGGRTPGSGQASDPTAWSDEELVTALAASDARAAEELWRRHSALVVRTLARMMGPGADVDDLTQEVFMHLFRQLPTLRDASALRSFVYSFVVRIARAELRRRWVRRILRPLAGGARGAGDNREDGDDVGDALAGPHVVDSGVPVFAARAAVRRLYAIIDTLDTRARAAYVLRFFEGESLEDTAAAVGVSLATVKRQLASASAEVNKRIEADPLLREYLPSGRGGET
jgi:RNA polymerase sigma-70 factor (ECF subfamily)